VELDLNQDGGKAVLAIRGGALVLPGVSKSRRCRSTTWTPKCNGKSSQCR